MAATDAGRALAALTAAALALPAFEAAADARDEATRISLRASQYGEAEVAREHSSSGAESERYDIDVYRLRLGLPVGERWRFTADGGYETLTGASPWFVQPDADGKPVQVMSGATIDEARGDAALDLRRYGESTQFALLLGWSGEKDYRSYNAGLEQLVNFGGDHWTLNLGAGYARDTIEPTEGGSSAYPLRPVEEQKETIDAVIGLTRILGRRTQLQVALRGFRHDGYLSDPYKQAWVDGSIVPDTRPDVRDGFSWSTRLRHRAADLGASVHLDYRYYHDSYEIESHTLELAWYQDLGGYAYIAPSVRYYTQSQAAFYSPYYNFERADGFYSSDYRLSPYGAITYGVLLNLHVGEQALSLSVEYYDSDSRYALEKVDVGNPGLVDFVLATAGLDFAF